MEQENTQEGRIVARGVIRGPEAGGSVVLLEHSPRGDVLRLEDYWIAQGAPDVRIYLTPDKAGNVEAEGAVEFGKVTSFSGSLVYAIPPDTSVRRMGAVVVYCKVYSVVFGMALLEHA